MTVSAANLDLVLERPAKFRQDVAITDEFGAVQRYDETFQGERNRENAKYALVMWIREYRDTGPYLNTLPPTQLDSHSYCICDSINDFDFFAFFGNDLPPQGVDYLGKQPYIQQNGTQGPSYAGPIRLSMKEWADDEGENDTVYEENKFNEDAYSFTITIPSFVTNRMEKGRYYYDVTLLEKYSRFQNWDADDVGYINNGENSIAVKAKKLMYGKFLVKDNAVAF